MHVVVAPDKFKGSLAASEIARHAASGISAEAPGVTVVQLPVPDGGGRNRRSGVRRRLRTDGTGRAGTDRFRVSTAFAVRDGVAVVEMADVSGLRPGIELVLHLVRRADHLPGARLVVTGEGSLDEQTLSGKAPARDWLTERVPDAASEGASRS